MATTRNQRPESHRPSQLPRHPTTAPAAVNSAQEVFFHIINNSTYHRAQIATELKQQGINPLATA
ncbi:DinB family protein [Eisenibacter elegans]|uniref:DinB family protein n=1 Tax=Eisenibacter elegans TaxID=997 RepID=UPI0009D644A4